MAIEGFDEWAWVIGGPTALVVGVYVWRRRPSWWEPIKKRYDDFPARHQEWFQTGKRHLTPGTFKALLIVFWVGMAGSAVIGFIHFINELDMTREERRRIILLSTIPTVLIAAALIILDSAANKGRTSGWLLVSWFAPIAGGVGLSFIEWYDTGREASNAEGAARIFAVAIPAIAFWIARELHRRNKEGGARQI